GWFTPYEYSTTKCSDRSTRSKWPGRATSLGQDQVLVEDVTEVAKGPVLRPNPATSLELQQLMRVMETMAQTMATQNAQINERFDQWLGQQNGQNGNQWAPNGVPAAGPQVEAQPMVLE
ncbi:unnamed protein product, partial [Prunus brigantina]